MLSKQLVAIILLTLMANAYAKAQRYTISGTISEKGSRETLIGVNVIKRGAPIGTSTNNYGFYALTLPASDSVTIDFSYVGYQTESRTFSLNKNITLNIEMVAHLEIEAVEIHGTQPKNSSRSAQTSIVEIPIKQVKALPSLLGEKDVLKAFQLMPGVQSGSEGNSGLFVRGGGSDQNLIILDDATVYNAFHLFGFFSLFNGDAIKSAELIKGGFPARYGGRLSSVMDIVMRDGNKEEFKGEAGIGLISSRAVIEGPIIMDKSSFLISARRSYADILARPFMKKNSDNVGGYFFYDLTAKANWEINPKNKIFISGYFGRDKFYVKEKTSKKKSEYGLFWDNATATVRWNKIFTDNLFSNLSAIFSNYRFKIFDEDRSDGNIYELSYQSGIRDYGLKYDFSWYPTLNQTIRFGIISTLHEFRPSAMVMKDQFAGVNDRSLTIYRDLETSLYCEDEVKIGHLGVANLGVRANSHYLDLETFKWHVEPRVSLTVFINRHMSIKSSYAIMNQYMHLLSNTGVGLPTDLWVPATKKAPAQKNWQAVLGCTYDLNKYSTTITVEGYYKELKNIITYRPGASFLLIDEDNLSGDFDWESNVTGGRGKSYGVEFMAHKKSGKFTGWAGYTLSWIKHQFDEVNNGKAFYPKHDRRHDISLVGTYEINKRLTFSASWVYGTGSAISIPIAEYVAEPHVNSQTQGVVPKTVYDYGDKNMYRMAPYHRLDVGLQFHKKKRNRERTWEVSIYNLYNRHNPYFYTTERDDVDNNTEVLKLKQVSIFPIIPSVSWSVKF